MEHRVILYRHCRFCFLFLSVDRGVFSNLETVFVRGPKKTTGSSQNRTGDILVYNRFECSREILAAVIGIFPHCIIQDDKLGGQQNRISFPRV